ncbi:uncharacterized protein LOC123221944 isoform X2 [Mangifera indica]|uniref:uncharacterized protein LOC123221944 isoform X2 n=1 Tax=Mangifera indica TaxID=29780 RepID=UPI001CF9E037|nr:uncharacterized protein LOC123221944 isoform X2 [Mangifera indica]
MFSHIDLLSSLQNPTEKTVFSQQNYTYKPWLQHTKSQQHKYIPARIHLHSLDRQKMGCGKSKHDVATGNTVARKKSNVGDQAKDIGTVLENGAKNKDITNSSLVQQQETNQNVNGDNPQTEVRDIAENKASGEEKHAPEERLISKESPNHFFSSRKEEEVVEGIVSDQKSDYDSPRLETAVKENLFNDNENVNNEVETTEETKNVEEAVVKVESTSKEAGVSAPTEKEESAALTTNDLKTV